MIKFESERSFEDFLQNEFNSTGMCPITDEEFDSCYRQFDTKSYGICDLVYVSSYPLDSDAIEVQLNIHVIELKTEQIKPADIAQICRYKTYFERATKNIKNVDLTFSLVVPAGISSSQDCCYLINALEDDVFVYEFSLSPSTGISFCLSNGYSKNVEKLSSVKCILPEGIEYVG